MLVDVKNLIVSPLKIRLSSVQFSCSVVSNSLRPYRLQHARHSCKSTTTRACSNSCPSTWWCHPTVSSSVIPFSCLQSFPASGSFLVSQVKYWSFSFIISPSNEHSGLISFRMDCLDLLSVQGTLKESSPTPQLKSINSSVLSHPYMTIGKTVALTSGPLLAK